MADVKCEVCKTNKTGEATQEGLYRGMCEPCAAAWQPPVEQRNEQTLEERIDNAIPNLREYLNNSAPTAAQTRDALKLLIRVVLAVIKLRRQDLRSTD